MAKFSQYDNYQKVGDKDLEYFLEAIKMCLYKEEVEVVRTLHFKGDADAAENLIREFPAFTPSGTFGDSRNNNSLLVYSNLIILDFDNVEELEVVFSKIMNLPYTLVAFRSAKGEGIKVLIKVNSDSYNHQFKKPFLIS